jgi:integrase/recombinase XerD
VPVPASWPPCLKEREQYLLHLMRRGYGPGYLRVTSGFMLRVVQFLGLTKLRMVGLGEIERASYAWASYRGPDRRGTVGDTTVRFPRVAKNWLRFHDRLVVPTAPAHPYEKEITEFREFLRRTNGASTGTIHGYGMRAKLFLSWLVAEGGELACHPERAGRVPGNKTY